MFIQAEDITEILMLEQRRLDDAFAQRETLVREVHHRIKNNLQGIAGLLEQTALDQPELLRPVRILASRIQTIAQVHGLQIHPGRAIPLGELVEAIALSIEQALGRPMQVELRDAWAG
ncbi:MAG: histidine kinase dimerization/phosphoacceptor domain -containing protein [Burkholderiaceae bacterium]